METTFDIPLRTFLRVVYGDDGQCIRQYHASCGNCADATVPAWDVSEDRSTELHGVVGSRTIAFSKPTELPSVVERLLGRSSGKSAAAGGARACVSFIEKQSLEIEPVTGNVLVRSSATLDSAWVSPERADGFVAVVEASYASTADADGADGADGERTAMTARIIVNAAGAWALQPVVERVMEHRAVAGFREWVVWVDEFVEKTKASAPGASGFAAHAKLPRLDALGLGSRDDDEGDAVGGDARAAFGAGPSGRVDAAGRDDVRDAASPEETTRKKRYPATPGASRRSSLSVEDDPGPVGPVVETPPRDERATGSADPRPGRVGLDVPTAGSAGSAASDDDWDDDASDDAASARSGGSFRSAASFVSARSSRWSDVSSTHARSARPLAAPRDRSSGPSASPNDPSEGGDEDVSAAREDEDATGATPRRARARSPVGAPASAARLDDAYRDGWFVQTVMNDLTALKTGAAEQKRLVAALEERTRALAAEHARLEAELRRGGARGGGIGLEHGGDSNGLRASGGAGMRVSLVRWTAALSLAAGAGYVLAASSRERR